MTRWTRRYLRTSQKSLERQIEGLVNRTDLKPNFGLEVKKILNKNFIQTYKSAISNSKS